MIQAPVGRGRALVDIRLPANRRSLNDPKLQRALDRLQETGKVSDKPGCTVFFVPKGAGYQAIQRCDWRKLKAHNREQCRDKEKHFAPCPRPRSRARAG